MEARFLSNYRSRYIVSFGLFTFFLLFAHTTQAQGPTDPCTTALPVGTATGCGMLITVLQVDAGGNATNYSIDLLGNGNPYDGLDDFLVGIINNSGTPLASITLTTAVGSPLPAFQFGKDGVCKFNKNDCFLRGSTVTGYEGPNNTFTVTDPTFNTGTVNFVSPVASGANTWFALDGTVSGNVADQDSNVTGCNPSVITQFSPPGALIQQKIEWPQTGCVTDPIPTPQMVTTNNPVSKSSAWPKYVAGTPWATSHCAVHPGNGGTDLCSLYINGCYNNTTGKAHAQDGNCPKVTNPSSTSFITLKDTWDPGALKPDVTPGTTVALIAFTPPDSNPGELWTASNVSPNPVCTNVAWSAATNAPVKCDTADRLVAMYGDQTTTRGTSPKTKSWNITAFDVPMLLTTVSAKPNASTQCPLTSAVTVNNPPANDATFAANIWNNGACLLDFVVNPAQAPPTPNNGYVAAPPYSLTYGLGATANATDSSLTNPNANGLPAAPWDTAPGISLWNLTNNTDGQYVIHWFASDTVGISEKRIQLIPSGSPIACDNPETEQGLIPPCYNTSLFTTQLNIDSVPPTITAIDFSSTVPTPFTNSTLWTLNQPVIASFSCSDPPQAAGITPSGIASCAGTGGVQGGGNINTSSYGVKTFTVTALDNASNQTTKSANYTVGDFTLTVTPASQTIPSGHQGNFTITVTPIGGLTGIVDIVCTDNIPSTTCTPSSFSDNLTSSPINTTVTLIASKNVTHGNWSITFTGTYRGSNVVRSQTVAITIK